MCKRPSSEQHKSMSKRFRMKLLAEVNYKCECCSFMFDWINRMRVPEVHHVDGDPSNNNRSNLLVLCIRCHNMIGFGGFSLETTRSLMMIGRKLKSELSL